MFDGVSEGNVCNMFSPIKEVDKIKDFNFIMILLSVVRTQVEKVTVPAWEN